jgi:hypothetical protein
MIAEPRGITVTTKGKWIPHSSLLRYALRKPLRNYEKPLPRPSHPTFGILAPEEGKLLLLLLYYYASWSVDR